MGGPNPGPPGGGVPPNHPEADTVRNPRTDKPDKSAHGFDNAGRSEFLETTLGALRTLLHSTSKEVGSFLPPVGFFRSKKPEPGTTGGAEPPVEDHLANLFPPKTGKEIQFETNPPSLRQSLNRLFGDLVGLATGTSPAPEIPATTNKGEVPALTALSSSNLDQPAPVATNPPDTQNGPRKTGTSNQPAISEVASGGLNDLSVLSSPNLTTLVSPVAETKSTPSNLPAPSLDAISSPVVETLSPIVVDNTNPAAGNPSVSAPRVEVATRPLVNYDLPAPQPSVVTAQNPVNLSALSSPAIDSRPPVVTNPTNPAASRAPVNSDVAPQTPPITPPALPSPTFAALSSPTVEATTPVVTSSPVVPALPPRVEIAARPVINPDVAAAAPLATPAPLPPPTFAALSSPAVEATTPVVISTPVVPATPPRVEIASRPVVNPDVVALAPPVASPALPPPAFAALSSPAVEATTPVVTTTPAITATPPRVDIASRTVVHPDVILSTPPVAPPALPLASLTTLSSPVLEATTPLVNNTATNPLRVDLASRPTVNPDVIPATPPAPSVAAVPQSRIDSSPVPSLVANIPVNEAAHQKPDSSQVPVVQSAPILTSQAPSLTQALPPNTQLTRSESPSLPHAAAAVPGPIDIANSFNSFNQKPTTQGSDTLARFSNNLPIVADSLHPKPDSSFTLSQPGSVRLPSFNGLGELMLARPDLADILRAKPSGQERMPDAPVIARSLLPSVNPSAPRELLARDLSDELTKRPPSNPSSSQVAQIAPLELPTIRSIQDPASQSRPIAAPEKSPTTQKDEYVLSSVLPVKAILESNLANRIFFDPTTRIVRDLAIPEQKSELPGYVRTGLPISGQPIDQEKVPSTSNISAINATSLATDNITPAGKRGGKEADQPWIVPPLNGRPIRKGTEGDGDTDAEEDEDTNTASTPGNTVGSSEPDPLPPSASASVPGNQDPTTTDPVDPNAPAVLVADQEIVGAMVLPNLEIIDPTQVQPIDPSDSLADGTPVHVDLMPPNVDRLEGEDEPGLISLAQATTEKIRMDSDVGQLTEKLSASPQSRKTPGAKTTGADCIQDIESLIDTLLADLDGDNADKQVTRRLLDDLFGDFEREEYVIQPGDTLESIATLKLKERRLVPLLYAINRNVLGETNDYSRMTLEPGKVIQLPHYAEILRFRIHVLGDPTPLYVYTEMNSAKKGVASKASSEERLTYTCRLGDTLTSIAGRHPLLQNPALWVLLARVNKLSLKADENAKPLAKVSRGKVLKLPTVKEIESFLLTTSHQQNSIAPWHEQQATETGQTPHTVPVRTRKNKAHAGNSQSHRQTKSPGGKFKVTVPPTLPLHSSILPMHTLTMRSVVQNVPQSRVITQGDLGDASNSLLLRLEVNHENKWLPVIEYSINSQCSGLKLYTIAGESRLLSIRLPTRAARELAENDMSANASIYCERFLLGAVR